LAADDEIRARMQRELEHNNLVTKEMYNILMQLRNGQDIGDVLSKLGDELFDEALERCYQSGYITGILPMRVASGRLVVDRTSGAEITPEGERFTVLYTPDSRR